MQMTNSARFSFDNNPTGKLLRKFIFNKSASCVTFASRILFFSLPLECIPHVESLIFTQMLLPVSIADGKRAHIFFFSLNDAFVMMPGADSMAIYCEFPSKKFCHTRIFSMHRIPSPVTCALSDAVDLFQSGSRAKGDIEQATGESCCLKNILSLLDSQIEMINHTIVHRLRVIIGSWCFVSVE